MNVLSFWPTTFRFVKWSQSGSIVQPPAAIRAISHFSVDHGNADVVSGDSDLLVLAGETGFAIESPEAYRQRVAPTD